MSSDADDEDSNDNNSTSGIGRLNNNHKILIEKEAEDTCMGVPIWIIEGSVPLGIIDGSVPLGIIEGSVPLEIIKGSVPLAIICDNEFGSEGDNKILLRIQGADLRRCVCVLVSG